MRARSACWRRSRGGIRGTRVYDAARPVLRAACREFAAVLRQTRYVCSALFVLICNTEAAMTSTRQTALVFLLGTAALLSPQPAGAATYHVELIGPPAGAPESTFATDLLAGGGVLGYAALGAFDPGAQPFAARGGTTLPITVPTDSLNFPLGAQRASVAAGSSSNRPVLWKKGKPKFLRPAGGLGSGFAQDVNGSGLICGAVFNDLTGAQFPAFWSEGSAAGVLLPGAPGLSPEG